MRIHKLTLFVRASKRTIPCETTFSECPIDLKRRTSVSKPSLCRATESQTELFPPLVGYCDSETIDPYTYPPKKYSCFDQSGIKSNYCNQPITRTSCCVQPCIQSCDQPIVKNVRNDDLESFGFRSDGSWKSMSALPSEIRNNFPDDTAYVKCSPSDTEPIYSTYEHCVYEPNKQYNFGPTSYGYCPMCPIEKGPQPLYGDHSSYYDCENSKESSKKCPVIPCYSPTPCYSPPPYYSPTPCYISSPIEVDTLNMCQVKPEQNDYSFRCSHSLDNNEKSKRTECTTGKELESLQPRLDSTRIHTGQPLSSSEKPVSSKTETMDQLHEKMKQLRELHEKRKQLEEKKKQLEEKKKQLEDSSKNTSNVIESLMPLLGGLMKSVFTQKSSESDIEKNQHKMKKIKKQKIQQIISQKHSSH